MDQWAAHTVEVLDVSLSPYHRSAYRIRSFGPIQQRKERSLYASWTLLRTAFSAHGLLLAPTHFFVAPKGNCCIIK